MTLHYRTAVYLLLDTCNLVLAACLTVISASRISGIPAEADRGGIGEDATNLLGRYKDKPQPAQPSSSIPS